MAARKPRGKASSRTAKRKAAPAKKRAAKPIRRPAAKRAVRPAAKRRAVPARAKATAYKMKFEHDVAIRMRDGAVLKANLFRPDAPGKFPVLMSFGPYGKDLHFSAYQPGAWAAMTSRNPDILQASSGKWMVFENADPEVWVPHGYAVVKVDSRGACKSAGKLDVNSPNEFRDFHDAIEWAGTQGWSSGKVGLLGISYYACGQWMVASTRPPHLAAILPWQGTSDFYRDRTRHGGMFCNGFVARWFGNIVNKQHGRPDCPYKDMATGERANGPASLTDDELRANRVDYVDSIRQHPQLDDWYRARSADLAKIDVPALVVANWGGLGLHLRGTITGWQGIASKQKWLKIQSGSYFATFYKPPSVALQRKFFDRYLKGIDNGWDKEPKVEVTVRGPGDTVKRTIADTQWPLTATRWTKLYLDARSNALAWAPPVGGAEASYPALGDGATFATAPLDRDMEFAGPVMAKLYVAASTADMDLFGTIRAYGPDGTEMTFFAATEPATPVSQGWLRVTQRKLDALRSRDYQPYQAHDESQPLVPGQVYEVAFEIWPASLYLPKGSRLTLTLQGKDFERPGGEEGRRGSGPFTHTDPVDRPMPRYANQHTIHTGGQRASYLQLPVIAGP
jgi:hypothetical protein